jgi:predicted PurR-regulated permease PerM
VPPVRVVTNNVQSLSPVTSAPATHDLEPLVTRSEEAWRRLWQRVRTITPAGLARFALVSGALAVIVWLFASAWSQLLPFQLGLVLAYITLPVVNAFSRVMPRWLAATLLVVMEIVGALALLGLLLPPVVRELVQLVAALPDFTQLQERVAELRARMNELPDSTQGFIRDAIDQVSQNVRTNLLGYVQAGVALAIAGILGLFNTLGFVIGFFGVPTWLVAVLTDQRTGARAVNRFLPDWIRGDFWAVVRIVDRTFSAFVRGQLLIAIAVGILTYLGLTFLTRVGTAPVQYQLILSLLAGIFQLIPSIGPILSTLLATVVGLTTSPRAGLAILALYVGIQLISNRFLSPTLAERYIDIHPAVFVIVLVLLSQFGFVWVLVAAPLSIVIRDLFRYAYGRLSEPPRPAGVLPR